MCAGASPPSAAGETAAEQLRDLRPRRGGPVLDQVQRRGGGGEISFGQAAAEIGPALHAAAEAMPFRAATIATTSRRMRVSSKSFGV